ncbi:MAG: recombinase RecT [Candidatus Kryptonium sp.]
MGLDPIKKEVHFVPFKGSVQLVVSYTEYIKRAERSGKLRGWETTMGEDSIGTYAEVVIYRKDWDFPFKWRAYLQEVQRDTATWKSSPLFMLRKTTIAQAFRLAFPEEVAHMPYTEEEAISINGEEFPAEEVKQIRMITEAQQKKIRVLLKELGVKERSEILELISSIINRTIESSTELTVEEASKVINALETELKARQEVQE